jgi:hypothetical protein
VAMALGPAARTHSGQGARRPCPSGTGALLLDSGGEPRRPAAGKDATTQGGRAGAGGRSVQCCEALEFGGRQASISQATEQVGDFLRVIFNCKIEYAFHDVCCMFDYDRFQFFRFSVCRKEL